MSPARQLPQNTLHQCALIHTGHLHTLNFSWRSSVLFLNGTGYTVTAARIGELQTRNTIGHDIHIWQVELDREPAKVARLARTLSRDEFDRARRFRFARDRDRFTVCRAALRQILAATLDADPSGLEFSTGAFGKPKLCRYDLHFNVAHSGRCALIAVSPSRELGIDIEEMRLIEDAQAIAGRFFSPEEFQRLCSLVDPTSVSRSFFECWTRKEAFIKAVGAGLSYPLNQISVTSYPQTIVQIRVGARANEGWEIINIEIDSLYIAALVFECCADMPNCSVVHRRWAPTADGDCSSIRTQTPPQSRTAQNSTVIRTLDP